MRHTGLVCLVAAFTAAHVHAEITPLNENELRASTGQAGITIEVQADLSDENIQWHDTGTLLLTGAAIESGNPGLASSMDLSFNNTDFTQLIPQFNHSTGTQFSSQYNHDSQLMFNGDISLGEQALTSNQYMSFGPRVSKVGMTPGQTNLENDNFGLYAASGAAIFMSDFNMDVVGIGDLLVDDTTDSVFLEAYFTAQNQSLESESIAITRDLYIHNSRGNHTLFRGGTSLASMQLALRMDTNSDGQSVVAMDIQSFNADIDLTNVAFGGGNVIGSLYLTDVHGTSNVLVYGH